MGPTHGKGTSVDAIKPYGMRDVSAFYSYVTAAKQPSVIITTAGQVGTDFHGSVPSDPIEQITLAFQNLKRCLESAGASIEDVMKLTYYIVDFDHRNPRHRQPLLEFLGSHRPVATLVPVPKLARPEYIFEVEATAAIPQTPPAEVDVVVVGGGLSGLQAAVDLQKAGLTVVVLEARDRVGGKTWSRPCQNSVVDVGAAWINDTNQSQMFNLVKEFGLDVIIQNTNGNIVVDDGCGHIRTHPYGQLIPGSQDKAIIEQMVSVRDVFENACQQIDIRNPVSSAHVLAKDLDSMTLEEWVQSKGMGSPSLAVVSIWTRAMLGVEPSEMSALYFLDYCNSGGGLSQMRSDRKHGGQYMRIKQGTQSFSQGLAARLSPGTVVLQSPVRNIKQSGGQVIVTSARGSYRASRVIVSVPTPLYKEIAFEPPLPPEKRKLCETTRLGSYCKSILVYNRPWWRDSGLCGLVQSSTGPFAVTRDTSDDETKQFSLTCFIVGQPARDWARLSPRSRRQTVVEQITRLYGPFAKIEEPIEVVEQIWMNEQWSQGCPCPVMPPGGLTDFEHVLRAPVDRVHFVGTETAFEWKGYMEGAVRSGQRGAQEILLLMNKSKI